MVNPMMAWAICSPENKSHWRAQAMRLAVGYAATGPPNRRQSRS